MLLYVLVQFTEIVSGVYCLNYVSNITEEKTARTNLRQIWNRSQPAVPHKLAIFQEPTLQIQLPDGLIQGQLRGTVDTGMPYYSYEGIPYAKPPVGKLRFRPPEAPEKWEGVLKADGDVAICIQVPSSTVPDWYESEDCLYINVYVPKLQSPPKPVMVWIYGGGFLFGVAKSHYYGPDYLLEEGVIVVHFNYRLNVFGFLSTEDLESPGNYGLKDQVFALKWIKTNIPLFGGDPEKITIFGESAGGASVQYQLLSPQSRGLFHRAISESGSVLCPWAFHPTPKRVAWQLGVSAGFRGTTSAELIEYLRSLSTKRLKRAALSVSIANSLNLAKSLPFAPCLEPEHDEAFITESSYELLKEGRFERVPQIVGFNSEEAGAARSALEFGEVFLGMVPSEVLIPPGMNSNDRAVGDKIREFYLSTNESTSQQYLDFISDSYFYRPITESARLYSIYAPVYMYRFSYAGYFLGKRAFSMGEESNVNGVMHSEEVWYIFSRHDLKRANDTDKLVRKRMLKLWTNFAKFGDPTPASRQLFQNVSWSRFEEDDYPYLNIDQNLSLRTNFKEETFRFWEELFREYGRPPFHTY